jgi:Zn-dependent protease with chaperone function
METGHDVAGKRFGASGVGQRPYFPDAVKPAATLRKQTWAIVALCSVILVLPLIVLTIFGWWPLALTLLVLQLLSYLITASSGFSSTRKLVRQSESVHPVNARTQPGLAAIVEKVCERMDVSIPPVFIMEDDSVNAFAAPTGLRTSVIIFNTGFL